MVVATRAVLAQHAQDGLGLRPLQHVAPALPVIGRLGRQMLRRRNVELPVQDRISRRVFVDVGGAVPDPLPGHEDRQLHMQLDLAHLEGGRVPVAHEVADQAAVVAGLAGAGAVGHAGRLHDGRVVAHVVHHAHEAVVERGQRLVKPLLQSLGYGPQGGPRGGAAGVDLGLVFGAQRHPHDLPCQRIPALYRMSRRRKGVLSEEAPAA